MQNWKNDTNSSGNVLSFPLTSWLYLDGNWEAFKHISYPADVCAEETQNGKSNEDTMLVIVV